MSASSQLPQMGTEYLPPLNPSVSTSYSGMSPRSPGRTYSPLGNSSLPMTQSPYLGAQSQWSNDAAVPWTSGSNSYAPLSNASYQSPRNMSPYASPSNQSPRNMSPYVLPSNQSPQNMSPYASPSNQSPRNMSPYVLPSNQSPQNMSPYVSPSNQSPRNMSPYVSPSNQYPRQNGSPYTLPSTQTTYNGSLPSVSRSSLPPLGNSPLPSQNSYNGSPSSRSRYSLPPIGGSYNSPNSYNRSMPSPRSYQSPRSAEAIDYPAETPPSDMERSPVYAPRVRTPEPLQMGGSPNKIYHHGASKAMDNGLSPSQKGFCGCRLDVEANKLAGKSTIVNVNAVCAKSTGTSSRYCGEHTKWDQLDDDRLRAYLTLNDLPTDGSRAELLDRIYAYKNQKMGSW